MFVTGEVLVGDTTLVTFWTVPIVMADDFSTFRTVGSVRRGTVGVTLATIVVISTATAIITREVRIRVANQSTTFIAGRTTNFTNAFY